MPIRSCTVETGGGFNCNIITDGSCDHSMDLGVVCSTYKQLCSAQQCSELPDQCPADLPTTHPTRAVATDPICTCTPISCGTCPIYYACPTCETCPTCSACPTCGSCPTQSGMGRVMLKISCVANWW